MVLDVNIHVDLLVLMDIFRPVVGQSLQVVVVIVVVHLLLLFYPLVEKIIYDEGNLTSKQLEQFK